MQAVRPLLPILIFTAAYAALSASVTNSYYQLVMTLVPVWAVFGLSWNLLSGYTGLISFGHAAFFGIGAYAAALFAKHLHPDPLLGLAVGLLSALLLGALLSVSVLRGSDLTRLMVTLGSALILYELANKLDWLTGGADGLQGVVMGPLLGRFEFDLYGRVAFGYSLALLVLGLLIARRIVASPFGWSLRAIRDNRLRAMAIGIPVVSRLCVIYTVSAAIAGAAGALLAQTTGFASLDVFDFHRSADVMTALIIGGAGWLYGGIVGAIAFKVLHDLISAVTTQYWTFWIGLFLVLLMLVGRDRLLHPARWFSRKP